MIQLTPSVAVFCKVLFGLILVTVASAWTTQKHHQQKQQQQQQQQHYRRHVRCHASTKAVLSDTDAPTVSPVMAAYEFDARGRELQELGSLNAAVAAFTKATSFHPTPDRYFRLGAALQENGEPAKALQMYEKVRNDDVSTALADPVLRHDTALKMAHVWSHDLGDVTQGILYTEAAMAEERHEHSAAAQDQKAFFRASQGKLREAICLWDEALDGGNVKDMGDGVDDDARFFRAVARALLGHDQEAEDDFAALPMERQYMVDGWRYIDTHYRKERGDDAWHRLFSGTYTNLAQGLSAARSDGLICEFGVFHGKSIRLLASMVNNSQTPVDGFDTFEGIPEAWGPEAAGTYTAAAEVPDVPDNVRFHIGLFADTLPGYVESLNSSPEELPVRLINVDCDLYQGTVEILHYLANRIGPGTVIIFDEYLMHPTWPEDEYKAFQEACDTFGWEYEYLSFSLFSKQAVVRITASKSFGGSNAAPS